MAYYWIHLKNLQGDDTEEATHEEIMRIDTDDLTKVSIMNNKLTIESYGNIDETYTFVDKESAQKHFNEISNLLVD